ncbi:MAG: pyridoxamine 5'-phosphate oxidase family protein [Candidatus Omnitrophota bacterium]
MKRLSDEIIRFFQEQGCVVVSTIDAQGRPHSSCKGIVKINQNGKIYLLDLYKARSYYNLKHNERISITALDEHRFKGYCLKGKARIILAEKLPPSVTEAWEAKINSRITQRVLKNLHEEKGHNLHPEVSLPQPQYLIAMETEEIVDLTPHHLKGGN